MPWSGGERSPQADRQRRHGVEQGIADVLRAMAVRQVEQQQVSGGALDQRPDRRAVGRAHDEVALPVPGDDALGDLRRPLVDHHHRHHGPPRALARPAPALAVEAPAAEQVLPPRLQAVGPGRVEGLVDRLRRRAHLGTAGEAPRQHRADLLRAPAALEAVGHEGPQLRAVRELPPPRAGPAARGAAARPVRVVRLAPRVPVPADLPADRGRGPAQSGGDRADAQAPDQPVRDRDPL